MWHKEKVDAYCSFVEIAKDWTDSFLFKQFRILCQVQDDIDGINGRHVFCENTVRKNVIVDLLYDRQSHERASARTDQKRQPWQ